jgi:Acetyltransferases
MATIRAALFPDELPLVRALFQEYADGLGVDLCFQGFAAELANLPGDYASPSGGLWLAEIDGDIAGCVALRRIDAERAEMKRLYVRPAFRGRGLGRALAEHVINEAARRGCRRICLDTLPSMGEAIQLYRALGFGEIEAYRDNPVPGAMYLGRNL